MKVKVLNAQTQIEVRIIDLQDFLARSGECLMGRSHSSGLVLESSDVSRLHGKFVSEQGQYYFYDLGSANGSLVNGAIAQANHGYLLRSGDIVRIGEFVLMMQAPNNLEDLPATVIGDPNATVVDGMAFGVMIPGFAVSEERIPEPVELADVVSDEIVVESETELEELTDSLEFDEDEIEDAIADQSIDEVIDDEVIESDTELEELTDSLEFDEDEIEDAIANQPISEVIEDESEDEIVENETVDEAIEDEYVDEVVESETINDELDDETIDEVDNEIIDDEIVDHTVDELGDAEDEIVEDVAINAARDEVIEEREYEEATVIQDITPGDSSETQPEISDPSEVIAALPDLDPDPWNDSSVVPGATSDTLASLPVESSALEAESTVIPTDDSLSIPSVVEVEDLSDTTVIQPDDLVDLDLADEPPDDATVMQLTDLVDEPSVIPQQASLSSLTELETELDELDTIAKEQEEEQESQAIAPSLEATSNQSTHEIDTAVDHLFDSKSFTIPGTTPSTVDTSEFEEEALEEELEEPVNVINQLFDSELPTVSGITLPTADILEFEEEILEEEIPEEEVFEEELEEVNNSVDLFMEPEPEEELTEPEEEFPILILETNTQAIPSTASLESAHSEILSALQKKYIVLLAHENQEAELIQLIESYQPFLSQCQTLTTPTLSNTLKRQIGFTVTQQTPTLLQGGYQSVNSLITAGKILAVLFARDFLTPQRTQSNDDALSRSCNVYGVLFASNLPTAEALIHSLQTKVTSAQ